MMDLRIDFMDETELRSTAQLSFRSLFRVAIVIVPVFVVLGIVMFVTKTRGLEHELELKRNELSRIQSDIRIIEERNAGYADDFALSRTIEGWQQAVHPWPVALSNIMANTPYNVQFRALDVTRVRPMAVGGVPARTYTMSLRGIAVSAAADDAIEELKSLFKSGMYTSLVADVSVQAGFANEGNKTDRRFEFQIRTKQRMFYAIPD